MGNEQLNILASERVDFGQVVIGHSCCTANLEYHISLLDRGVFLGFDRFGLEREFPDRLRKASLAGLLAIGHTQQIVLSQSAVGCFLGRPLHRTPESQRGLEHWNYVHLFKDILPQLREIGISEIQIRTMLVDNPQRIFGRPR
jgi:phosphotriesterase-related protein